MDPLCVDLRGVSAAADPLFQTLGERLVIQLQATAQGALPDDKHPPALLSQLLPVANAGEAVTPFALPRGGSLLVAAGQAWSVTGAGADLFVAW